MSRKRIRQELRNDQAITSPREWKTAVSHANQLANKKKGEKLVAWTKERYVQGLGTVVWFRPKTTLPWRMGVLDHLTLHESNTAWIIGPNEEDTTQTTAMPTEEADHTIRADQRRRKVQLQHLRIALSNIEIDDSTGQAVELPLVSAGLGGFQIRAGYGVDVGDLVQFRPSHMSTDEQLSLSGIVVETPNYVVGDPPMIRVVPSTLVDSGFWGTWRVDHASIIRSVSTEEIFHAIRDQLQMILPRCLLGLVLDYFGLAPLLYPKTVVPVWRPMDDLSTSVPWQVVLLEDDEKPKVAPSLFAFAMEWWHSHMPPTLPRNGGPEDGH